MAVDEHGQLIAFANGGADRTEPDPYAIYVRDSSQGNGVGRCSVAAATNELTLQGDHRSGLGSRFEPVQVVAAANTVAAVANSGLGAPYGAGMHESGMCPHKPCT